jgi:hypothetical protein
MARFGRYASASLGRSNNQTKSKELCVPERLVAGKVAGQSFRTPPATFFEGRLGLEFFVAGS